MANNKTSNQYFEQIADQWDTLRAGYFSEEVREAAIGKAFLLPDMVVADVGGGTGFMAGGLAPIVQKVHLLDFSPAILEIARKNLARFSNIEYHLVDGQSLSLPDQSVDAVFANMYLHHCPDPLAAIREMARILKPGGRLVITDIDAHENLWMREEMADIWLGFDRELIQAWFEKTGFVNVLVDCTGQNCCAQAKTTPANTVEQSAEISVFVATGTRRIRMQEEVRGTYTLAAETGCGCGCETQPETYSEGAPRITAASSCCSAPLAPAADFITSGLYTVHELSVVPLEAGEISLGCGNPVALANLKIGETVLDIGSGGGLDSFLAARQVGADGRVIGVDMTPAMLARARQAAEKAGIQNVEFRQGEAESLPVESGSVDVVLSNCVINLCEDKGLAFREIFRVLKPGGRLELSDMIASGGLPLAARQNADEWAGCVSGALPGEEYTGLIRQVGFVDIKMQRGRIEQKINGVSVFNALISARKPE